jgi:hypothetical protein
MLQIVKQAITVAAREDNLEQLFAETCRIIKPSTAGWRLGKPEAKKTFNCVALREKQ